MYNYNERIFITNPGFPVLNAYACEKPHHFDQNILQGSRN